MRYIALTIMAVVSLNAKATCYDIIPPSNHDLLAAILQETSFCIKNVQSLKFSLKEHGLTRLPAMVANRGAQNPDLGSFSLFESVTGFSSIMGRNIHPEHFYFGHFTDLNERNEVILDQTIKPNKLLVEVMAFDFKKGMYNFYELVGTTQGAKWFYRGDSSDAYEDNKLLKIGTLPSFGTRMRCSACHSSGGPIMKELDFPHNDWWTRERGLMFGPNKPSEELQEYFSQFIDAREFSKNVIKGMDLLEKKSLIQTRSLKERLRPLFCATEINLKSDSNPSNSPADFLSIPSDVFVNPLLVKSIDLKMDKSFYQKALASLGSKFPETKFQDADHAFLSPVKGRMNLKQIEDLISSKLIDEEFAVDVLSIDFETPLFSKVRCDLLKLVPETSDWRNQFKNNLLAEASIAAKALAQNLGKMNLDQHRQNALKYLSRKHDSWQSEATVVSELRMLNKLRLSVFQDEISKNPKGQILEPGFRVIFPLID